MEKRFIVIGCCPLNDQFECDADRRIIEELYTKEEILEFRQPRYKIVPNFLLPRDSQYIFDTRQEAEEQLEKAIKENAFELETTVENFLVNFNYWDCPKATTVKQALFRWIDRFYPYCYECYEILDNGKIIPREDLSTYHE